jgi:hypothetical protein
MFKLWFRVVLLLWVRWVVALRVPMTNRFSILRRRVQGLKITRTKKRVEVIILAALLFGDFVLWGPSVLRLVARIWDELRAFVANQIGPFLDMFPTSAIREISAVCVAAHPSLAQRMSARQPPKNLGA